PSRAQLALYSAQPLQQRNRGLHETAELVATLIIRSRSIEGSRAPDTGRAHHPLGLSLVEAQLVTGQATN
ncbi:MAG TPA: hypothetical protein VG649_18650, partial [Candidatus Angelobacter sp.]|nr:hypothetical protein [Candidatus Angelobacter sp.]